MIEALVVDDSNFMRTVIKKILQEGNIEVVATAKDGKEAIEKTQRNNPDVITMDVEMPVMNGIEAVEEIMEKKPTPILMLSALTKKGAEVSFEALDKGAVDFMPKPGGETSIEISKSKKELIKKVNEVARSEVKKKTVKEEKTKKDIIRHKEFVDNPSLIIGASTGGPKSIESILCEIPHISDLKILVVQHMSSPFTNHFAERLDKSTEYGFKESGEVNEVKGGEGVVAEGGKHMKVIDYVEGIISLETYEGEPINSVRPSIDVTMKSAAIEITDPVVGVLLTGMGADGVEGAKALKQNGAKILVQNKESSQVYGIPKKAKEAIDVDEVFSLDEMSDGVLDQISLGG